MDAWIVTVVIATLLIGSVPAEAATQLEKFLGQVGKYAVPVPQGVPPAPSAARKGLCLGPGAAFGPEAGTLTVEEYVYSSPQRTRAIMRCWLTSYDTATGANEADALECPGAFYPLAK
jgi:hypothetical protein